MINQNSAVRYNPQEDTVNITNNTEISSYKQRVVKSIKEVCPYIAFAVACTVVGAITGYATTEILSKNIMHEYKYGSNECNDINNTALTKSDKKMFAISMATSFISAILSPIIYIAYNDLTSEK